MDDEDRLRAVPPTDSEIEVSVLGPGFGESIVIHAGCGHWIIVDSCLDHESKQPASIEYLYSIGLDPADTVKCVIASHWHDDHIRGLSDTVSACPNAKFMCASGLNHKEFLTITDLYRKAPIPFRNGIAEFSKVLEVLRARPNANLRSPKMLIADRPIWSAKCPKPGDAGFSADILLTSLSPTDGALKLAIDDIGKLFAQVIEAHTLKAIRPFSPNHLAVALWLSAGPYVMLLGSDLEELNSQGCGWSAVVASPMRPAGKATIFKIPHHGSITAHSEDVWSKMIDADQPVAILTPFRHGRVPLPTQTDALRILAKTASAYTSNVGQEGRTRRRSPKVQRLISATAKPIWRHGGPVGHVRYRADLFAPGHRRIEVFRGASLLAA